MKIMNDLISLFMKILGSINVLLLFASLILNSFVLFICLRSKKLRSTSTFKLLAFGSVNDIFSCLPWNFEDFCISFLSWQPYSDSLFYCRWSSIFLQSYTFNLISWILVTVSLDRLLSMTIKKWSNIYFAGCRPVLFVSILAFIIFTLYLNQVFTIGKILIVNGTEKVDCYVSAFSNIDWFRINVQVKNFYILKVWM